MELNEKIILERTEAKINDLYIKTVLSEKTQTILHGLSMGYRPAEVVRFLKDRGYDITLNQVNVLKSRYKPIIKEARALFEDLTEMYHAQIEAEHKRGGK